ncbi:MBL fold metallo-hydrolase [Fibrisoma montanum]|uniref:MBL fold metallo-hydrolase n=1 Tax=Fibrisoma montanum TaxID=2305895 RepID=A0A418MBZ9_9BACT|nr:MBL fold metallo-hydrolase [Fibrisoma montanum]RIV23898.1 MBL fold metallo-hydrolase [Fibrisoma montanum]
MNMTWHCLDVPFTFNGINDTLHPVILRNQRETLVIDCGYAGFMPRFETAANRHGLSLADLTGVIISHHDIDHVGGLYELKQQYPSLKVYASPVEAASITGQVKSARLLQAENLFPSLPDDQKPGALAFQQRLSSIRPVHVDAMLSSGDQSAIWDDVQIIDTPGHTPGHISVYLPSSRTLIACDALVVENGAFNLANPHFAIDLKQAVDSVRTLQSLTIDRVICYHGGLMEGAVQQKLAELLSRYT